MSTAVTVMSPICAPTTTRPVPCWPCREPAATASSSASVSWRISCNMLLLLALLEFLPRRKIQERFLRGLYGRGPTDRQTGKNFTAIFRGLPAFACALILAFASYCARETIGHLWALPKGLEDAAPPHVESLTVGVPMPFDATVSLPGLALA